MFYKVRFCVHNSNDVEFYFLICAHALHKTNKWVGLALATSTSRYLRSNFLLVSDQVNAREPLMSEGEQVDAADQLLLACQNGDAHTLQAMMSSVAGLDLSMTTEDGVTLLMHTIIGAGEVPCTCTICIYCTNEGPRTA